MNEITQKFEFKEWIPIIVSICSLVFSVVSYMKSERIKRKNEIITKLLMEQSTRASVVPYFNIVLRDERIIESKDKITLGIGVINIGKESATNVQLEPVVPKLGLEGYFKSDIGYNYGISEYLNRYYARPGEEIIFYIGIFKKDNVSDFLNFKIKYYDLIGNCYVQEFRFGFDNYLLNGFNLNNTSYIPKLIKNDK